MQIKTQRTKTLVTKDNGRSSDAVSPNFIYGCAAKCMYCYIYRNSRLYTKMYVNENVEDIFNSINNWVEDKPWPKVPNQTDLDFYTIDIGCSTDLFLHRKLLDLEKIFDFFMKHDRAKATFATKFPTLVPKDLKVNNKIRCRVSLMPSSFRYFLEPNTNLIMKRLESIPKLQELGYEVHINYSPVVVDKDWLKRYEDLFMEVNKVLQGDTSVKCEVIFMTHNEHRHRYNLSQRYYDAEDMLWKPEIQEDKVSNYGSKAIRYKWQLKNQYKEQFVRLHNSILPYQTIRYAF